MNCTLFSRRDFLKNAAVSAAAGWVAGKIGGHAGAVEHSSAQPIFDRVLQTRTLRGSYIAYPPYVIKDPNTGALSGIFYELAQQIGRVLNLKIEWAAETTYTTMVEEMKQGRFDAFLGGLWAAGHRAASMDFTVPAAYAAVGVYVRTQDHRFDADLELINRTTTRIATLDGAVCSLIAASDFPQASTLALPNTADYSLVVENLVSGKADVAFLETLLANRCLARNPGAIRNIAPHDPIRVFGNTMTVLKGETKLRDMLSVAIEELLHDGTYARIERRYSHPGDFYPVARPYQTVETARS